MGTNSFSLPEFPICLMMTQRESNARILDPASAHNRVIGSWISEHEGMTGNTPITSDERAILLMAAGFDGWCRWKREDAASSFGSEEITNGLYRTFLEALNMETGRLDCGTLDGWARSLMEALDIDPD